MRFYENITITKVIVIAIIIQITVGIICNATVISTFGNDGVFNILIKAGMLIWLFFEFIKSNDKIENYTKNLGNVINWKEIGFVTILHFLMSIAFVFLALYILACVSPQLMEKTWSEDPYDFSGVLMFIGACIFAPVSEELIFRGIILNRLKIKFGINSAIIVSSILFGIMHPSLGRIGAIIMGILMCLLYLKTNNIIVTMIAHMLNNVIVICLVSGVGISQDDVIIQQNITVQEVSGMFFKIGLPILFVCSIFFIYYLKKNWPSKYKFNN